MARFRNYQTNFSGGLLSAGMNGRLDLAQYENGCRQLTNFWPKVTGGMRRRPGTKYLNSSANVVRIESFIFSETQTYIVAFGTDNDIEFFDDDTGALIDTLTITGITLNATVIAELNITQTGDVMFCAHPTFATLMIRRTSATTFAQEAYDFETLGGVANTRACPFFKFADIDTTVSVNGYIKGAAATATSSPAAFEDRHVGRIIRYRGKQMLVSSLGAAAPSATAAVVILEGLDRGVTLTFDPLLYNPQDYIIGEIVVASSTGVKLEVVETSSTSIVCSYIAGLFPIAAPAEEIVGLTSDNTATFTANTNVTPLPSSDWDEEVFTPDNGYPSVIEFHSQRLWLAGSSSLPAHIFGSRVAAFFNFDVGDGTAADSIQVSISDNQVNLITDVVSGRHLQVFTDHAEFYAPQSEDLPLTPGTFNLIKQTRYGSKETIKPLVFDESTIYVQAHGNAIREYIWVDGQRGYSSDAISLIAEEHVNDIQELEILYGGYDRPEQIAFFVNGDGTITWYHSARAEGIRTWGKWTTQGNYKSVCVISDKLFALVDRDAGMAIERFELDITLDCVLQYTDTPAKSSWSSIHPFLEGETLQVGTSVVQAEHNPDYYIGEEVLTSGVIDVSPIEVDNITVGLGYTQTLETMPIEVKDTQGVSGGLAKRIIQSDIYLSSALAVQLEGNRVTTYVAGEDLSLAPTPITGPRKFYLLGYSERPTLTVENEIPVPCEVLSLGAEVEY